MRKPFTRRSIAFAGVALVTGLALSACGSVGETGTSDSGPGADGKYDIVLVSKVEGISWFEAMNEGVMEFNEDYTDQVNARQTGPDTGDPAKQVQIVEDLIAQGVDAIVVVPNDPQSIAPVLKKARDAGIVVVTHEAPALVETESIDYDVESFDNAVFGEGLAENLAEQMGGEGQFIGMVGSLTSETHMAWYNAAVAYFAENYPDIEVVAEQPYEDDNDDAKARANAEEIVRAYPDLKGYIGTSVSAGSNFAQILKEKNLSDISTSVLSLPSVAGPYLEEDWLGFAQTWSPASAGYVASLVALNVLEGKEIATGDDYGQEGYESIVVDGKLVVGDAILKIEKGTFAPGEYPF